LGTIFARQGDTSGVILDWHFSVPGLHNDKDDVIADDEVEDEGDFVPDDQEARQGEKLVDGAQALQLSHPCTVHLNPKPLQPSLDCSFFLGLHNKTYL